MESEGIWRVVATVGKLNPTEGELAQGSAALEKLDPEFAFSEITAHRVYTLALENLLSLPGERRRGNTAEVISQLEKLVDAEKERLRLAIPHTRSVLETAAEYDAHVIKGLGLRENYPDPQLRHIGDLDLHVPDWSRAVGLVTRLRRGGWEWDTDEFPWVKWTDGGSLYGQLSMVLADGAADGEPHSRVDVHIGPFSVGHSALMPLVGWRQRDVLGVPAPVPCPESELALVGAHAANDGLLSMKDVNDVHAALAWGRHIDWASVEELCRAAGVTDAMADILAAVAEAYPDSNVPSWRAEGGTRAPGRPGYLSVTSESGSERATRVGRLTLADERARGREPSAAERLAAEAERYFSADLTPHLGEPEIPHPSAEHRRRNLCWRLLPRRVWDGLGARAGSGTVAHPEPPASVEVTEEAEIAEELRLVRSPRGAVLLVGAGREALVPTVWGAVDPESVTLARTLAADAGTA